MGSRHFVGEDIEAQRIRTSSRAHLPFNQVITIVNGVSRYLKDIKLGDGNTVPPYNRVYLTWPGQTVFTDQMSQGLCQISVWRSISFLSASSFHLCLLAVFHLPPATYYSWASSSFGPSTRIVPLSLLFLRLVPLVLRVSRHCPCLLYLHDQASTASCAGFVRALS